MNKNCRKSCGICKSHFSGKYTLTVYSISSSFQRLHWSFCRIRRIEGAVASRRYPADSWCQKLSLSRFEPSYDSVTARVEVSTSLPTTEILGTSANTPFHLHPSPWSNDQFYCKTIKHCEFVKHFLICLSHKCFFVCWTSWPCCKKTLPAKQFLLAGRRKCLWFEQKVLLMSSNRQPNSRKRIICIAYTL